MEFLAWGLFGLSLGANAALSVLYWRRRRTKEPRIDVSAQDLLHDLTRRGSAILKIDVIDPANLLLRSPRR